MANCSSYPSDVNVYGGNHDTSTKKVRRGTRREREGGRGKGQNKKRRDRSRERKDLRIIHENIKRDIHVLELSCKLTYRGKGAEVQFQ